MGLIHEIEKWGGREYALHLAPWIGIAAGAIFGLRFYESDSIALKLVTGGGAGFISGCLLYVFLHPSNATAGPNDLSPNRIFWAIAGLVFAIIPFLGFPLALISFGINSGCSRWTKTCSYIAIGISLLSIAVAMVFVVITDGDF